MHGAAGSAAADDCRGWRCAHADGVVRAWASEASAPPSPPTDVLSARPVMLAAAGIGAVGSAIPGPHKKFFDALNPINIVKAMLVKLMMSLLVPVLGVVVVVIVLGMILR